MEISGSNGTKHCAAEHLLLLHHRRRTDNRFRKTIPDERKKERQVHLRQQRPGMPASIKPHVLKGFAGIAGQEIDAVVAPGDGGGCNRQLATQRLPGLPVRDAAIVAIIPDMLQELGAGGQERRALFHTELEHTDNMGVREPRDSSRLGKERVERVVGQANLEDFDSSGRLEIDMLGQIHRGEAPLAEEPDQSIIAQLLSDTIGHRKASPFGVLSPSQKMLTLSMRHLLFSSPCKESEYPEHLVSYHKASLFAAQMAKIPSIGYLAHPFEKWIAF